MGREGYLARKKQIAGMGGGIGTVGTFNDGELQVMGGNAPYLTPHLIPSHEITPAASPLIFSYRRRAPLFRLTSHCTSTRDSYLRTLLVRPNYYASRTQFRARRGITSHLVCTRTPWGRDCEGWASHARAWIYSRFASLSSVSFRSWTYFGNLILSSETISLMQNFLAR